MIRTDFGCEVTLDLSSYEKEYASSCARFSGSADYFDSDFAVTEVTDFDFSDPPIRSKIPDNLELITIYSPPRAAVEFNRAPGLAKPLGL